MVGFVGQFLGMSLLGAMSIATLPSCIFIFEHFILQRYGGPAEAVIPPFKPRSNHAVGCDPDESTSRECSQHRPQRPARRYETRLLRLSQLSGRICGAQELIVGLAESNNYSQGCAGGEYPEFSAISATLVRGDPTRDYQLRLARSR